MLFEQDYCNQWFPFEITASLTANDIVEVDYTYNKYSDTELDSFITSALVWHQVEFNTERFDDGDNYDNVNDRFIAKMCD